MKLNNPFTNDTRILYLYRNDCDTCGSNQMLEINHITGRSSKSPLNASILCRRCHMKVGHNIDEEQKLFAKNLKFLLKEGYKLTQEDHDFLEDNKDRLVLFNPHITKWLDSA